MDDCPGRARRPCWPRDARSTSIRAHSPPATCAQSLFGHVNALFDKHDDAPTFTVMVARSFARDTWHALCESAAQYGYDVLPPAPFR